MKLMNVQEILILSLHQVNFWLIYKYKLSELHFWFLIIYIYWKIEKLLF